MTLKKNYPDLIGRKLGFEIMHVSQYLAKNVDLNIKAMKPVNLKAAIHNPCHLNRGLGAPHDLETVATKIPGFALVQMQEPDRCCGAGGGVRAGERSMSMLMARRKGELIINSGAEACVTQCPFCYIQIRDILKQLGYEQIQVYDLAEVMTKAYRA
jgi:fumarate reductase (CoM/CoB) subunit B